MNPMSRLLPDWLKRILDDYQTEARTYANFPTLYLSLVNYFPADPPYTARFFPTKQSEDTQYN